MYGGVVWNKIWKRSFLEQYDLKCKEGVYYEDLCLTVPGIIKASKVVATNHCFYNYRIRANSIARQIPSQKHITDFYNCRIKFLHSILKDKTIRSDKTAFKKMLSRSLFGFSKYLASYPGFDMFKLKYIVLLAGYNLRYSKYLFKIVFKKMNSLKQGKSQTKIRAAGVK